MLFKCYDIHKSYNNVAQAQTKAAILIMVKWKMLFNHQTTNLNLHQFNDLIRMPAVAHQVVLLPISTRKV